MAEEENARSLRWKLRVSKNDKTVHGRHESGFYSKIKQEVDSVCHNRHLSLSLQPEKNKEKHFKIPPKFLKSKVYLVHMGARRDTEALNKSIVSGNTKVLIL